MVGVCSISGCGIHFARYPSETRKTCGRRVLPHARCGVSLLVSATGSNNAGACRSTYRTLVRGAYSWRYVGLLAHTGSRVRTSLRTTKKRDVDACGRLTLISTETQRTFDKGARKVAVFLVLIVKELGRRVVGQLVFDILAGLWSQIVENRRLGEVGFDFRSNGCAKGISSEEFLRSLRSPTGSPARHGRPLFLPLGVWAICLWLSVVELLRAQAEVWSACHIL